MFSVPKGINIPKSRITFEMRGGSYAQFFLAERDGPACLVGNQRVSDVCPTHWGFIMATWDATSGAPQRALLGSTWDTGHLPPGIAELYIVSDGATTLEFTIPGLSGDSLLAATGEVDAVLAELPGSCYGQQDCPMFGSGGLTNRMRSPGWVTVASFSSQDSAVGEPGFVSTRNCIYPGQAFQHERSTDPRDYPYGCAAIPDEYDVAHPFLATDRWAIHQGELVIHGTQYGRVSIQSYEAREERNHYVGFQSVEASVSPGGFAGYGIWLTAHITCPSGNWLACPSPGGSAD